MVDTEYQQLFHTFFDSMASQLAAADAEALSNFFHIPTVFVSDGNKQICANKKEVIENASIALAIAGKKRATVYEFEIPQAVKLSDSIFFVQVIWRWKDDQGQEVLNRMTSYTLQEVSPTEFNIVVSVFESIEE